MTHFRRRALWSIPAILVLLTACEPEDLLSQIPDAAPADAAPPDARICPTRIAFFNRHATTYFKGDNDDPVANVSQLLKTSSFTTEPYPHGDEDWEALMACLRDRFEPYGIRITDEDPGDVAHFEIAITGNIGADMGYPEECGRHSGGCGGVDQAISFTFNGLFPFCSTRTLACVGSAHAVGHALGLEDMANCADVMWSGHYRSPCGEQRFRDEDSDCGWDEPGECSCTEGTTSNTHQMLLEALGPACP